jgi:hypothetical protein
MRAGLRDAPRYSEEPGQRHERQGGCYEDRGRPTVVNIDEAVQELSKYFGWYEADSTWLRRISGNYRVGGDWI